MKEGTPISSIMTRDVITVDVTAPLEVAEQYFKRKHIRHIPVTKNGKIKGMLSYNDLLRISFADSLSSSTARILRLIISQNHMYYYIFMIYNFSVLRVSRNQFQCFYVSFLLLNQVGIGAALFGAVQDVKLHVMWYWYQKKPMKTPTSPGGAYNFPWTLTGWKAAPGNR